MARYAELVIDVFEQDNTSIGRQTATIEQGEKTVQTSGLVYCKAAGWHGVADTDGEKGAVEKAVVE